MNRCGDIRSGSIEAWSSRHEFIKFLARSGNLVGDGCPTKMILLSCLSVAVFLLLIPVLANPVIKFNGFLGQYLTAPGDSNLCDHAMLKYNHAVLDDAAFNYVGPSALSVEVENDFRNALAEAAISHQ